MDYLDNGYKVVRIVVTGGPCGGKTTAIDRIKEVFQKEGYQILIIPETATQLITNGISPRICKSMASYQYWQMRMQLEKEKIYSGAAEEIAGVWGKDILIICDRGMLDNKAYVTDEEFEELLQELGYTEGDCLSWYDGVFHMMTAAKGAEKFYTLSNNAARGETLEEAAALDDRGIYVWENHPVHVILDNSTGFEEKLQRLTDGIRNVLKDLDSEQ
ncbi:MAG: ATP-binding protein [Eubacterium sp.]|nr:ATP-binding protein [Eubacterium sp.]